MKKMMISHNIPTAKYFKVRSIEELEGVDLRYPLIVKPTDSNSSKGVRRANTPEELVIFLSKALESGRKKEAIVEEFIKGREIGIDSIIIDGKATLVLSRERIKIENNDKTQQIYGSFWPAGLDSETELKFKTILEKIAETFHLDNTPLMIQSILNDDGISIIEFAPRIGGGENFNIIKKSTGFDIIDAAIDSFLGNDIKLDIKEPTTIYFDNYLYCYPGEFKEIVGLEKLVEEGIAEYFNIYKEEGAKIGSEMSSNNRVGVFTVKGSNPTEVYTKIMTGVNSIQVFDHKDKPIMRKNIYQDLNNK
jgi:biotin carboxylase